MPPPEAVLNATPPVFVRESNLTRTRGQVDVLLNICNHASNFLASNPDIGTQVVVDPVLENEARKTYELAALQLRNLLDDPVRWGSAEPDTEQLARKVLVDTAAHLAEERRVTAEKLRPSTRLNPTLRLTEHQGWLAWHGNIPTANSLHAFGASPEEALKNFDAVFERRVELNERAAEDKPAEEAPKAKPSKKRKKK